MALFTFLAFIQMTIWAKGKHKTYSREFKDYPHLRMPIIPLLLWARYKGLPFWLEYWGLQPAWKVVMISGSLCFSQSKKTHCSFIYRHGNGLLSFQQPLCKDRLCHCLRKRSKRTVLKIHRHGVLLTCGWTFNEYIIVNWQKGMSHLNNTVDELLVRISALIMISSIIETQLY